MFLRPYQQQAADAILAGFTEWRKQLLVAPTGSGKTIIFAHLAKAFLPGRTLILAHREELIDQAVDKVHRAAGITAEKEMSEDRATHTAPVVVASVQSMIRRLDRWPANHFTLVVADEAHHAISPSWQKVLNHFAEAKVLGVTATPDRGDRRNLGAYFENVPAEIGLFDLIHQGYLCPITLKSLPLQIDITQVDTRAGDYDEHGLDAALRPYLRQIARAIWEECLFRRTLVFLPLIATSKAFADLTRAAGLTAIHVDGADAERSEKIKAFGRGDFDLAANAMLLTEGYDNPGIDCVVILRPTKSRSLYSQMVGRGTRIAPGKENLLLLDFLWLHERHKLVRPAHLVAENEQVADEMTEAAAATGGVGVLDLEYLHTETQAKREARLQEELAAKAKRRARVIDAREFAASLHAMDAAEFEPAMPWEGEPISEGQAAVLRKFGLDLDTVTCRGHASKLLDLLITRSKRGMASPKQIRLLRQLRYPRPEMATFADAKRYLDTRLHRDK